MKWLSWDRNPTLEQLLPLLEHWFRSEAGLKILDTERKIVNENLSSCFGYHLLQISVSESCRLYDDCKVQRQYRYHLHKSSVDIDLSQQRVLGDYEQLPFESDSLDVVILHHIQEYCQNPHQLLREVQRIVVPYGHVIIIGFNPWSAMACSSRFTRFLPKTVWHNKLISSRRISDWLSVLGFEITTSQYGFSTPKIVEEKTDIRFWPLLKNIPCGSIYVISARKQQTTMTPIRPVWKVRSEGFSGLSPAKSTVANHLMKYEIDESEDVA